MLAEACCGSCITAACSRSPSCRKKSSKAVLLFALPSCTHSHGFAQQSRPAKHMQLAISHFATMAHGMLTGGACAQAARSELPSSGSASMAASVSCWAIRPRSLLRSDSRTACASAVSACLTTETYFSPCGKCRTYCMTGQSASRTNGAAVQDSANACYASESCCAACKLNDNHPRLQVITKTRKLCRCCVAARGAVV